MQVLDAMADQISYGQTLVDNVASSAEDDSVELLFFKESMNVGQVST